MSKEMSGIELAVQWAGSQSALARKAGVSPQAVQQWVERGRVPPRRVPLIADMTGIAAHRLNPESHLGHYGGQHAAHIAMPAPLPVAVCEQSAGYCPRRPAKAPGKNIRKEG